MLSTSRSLLTLFRLGAFALSLLAVAPAVHAADDDDPEVVAQAKEHYKAGLEAYKAGKYDVAIRELKKAYLLKRLPPLLLNIGATYRKMGDLDLSLHFYQKFLDEAPSDHKDRPEVERIVGEIKKEKAAPAAGSSDEPRPDDQPARRPRDGGGSGGAGEWNHNVIDAVPPDMPIDVRVSTPVMKGVKVFVYYRGAGQADFNSVLTKRRGKEKVGRIPAAAVNGRSLQYYIEAKDAAGTVVKSSGSTGNPNIIMVEEGVKPVMIASARSRDDEEDQPRDDEEDRPKKRKPTRDLDDESAPTAGNVSDDEPVQTVRPRKTGGMTSLMKAGIGLLAGGGGLAIGGGVMLGLAARTASTLTADSLAPTDVDGNPIYFNNDPLAPGAQEAQLESRGKLYNTLGIAFTAVGGVAAAAGIGILIADAVIKSEKAHPKKKKRKKRRVVEEDEEEEARNWFLAPVTGPTVVGVSGGFSF